MDTNFLERIQNISLTSKEEEPITIRVACREAILKEYSVSLIEKFMTTRPFNIFVGKPTTMGVGLRIVELREQYVGAVEVGEESDNQDGMVQKLADVGLGLGSTFRPYQRGSRTGYQSGYRERGGSGL
nr:hypothetical protein CFP56_22753 [Quercus suber]